MRPRTVFSLNEAEPESGGRLRELVVAHLLDGGLLAYPTETVYGVGGIVTPALIEGVRQLKGRPEDKPFLLLIPSGAVGGLGLDWGPAARRLAEHFWPGPLTLVLGDPKGTYPKGVRSSDGGVAVRVTPHGWTGELVEALALPLLSTSANRPGEGPLTSGGEIARVLAPASPEEEQLWIIDGGMLPPSPPSTVLSCLGDRVRLVRAGAVPLDHLREVIPEIDA